MASENTYRFKLPDSGEPLREWMLRYGKELTTQELADLIHKKHSGIPPEYFVVWAHSALMGAYSGWLFDDRHQVLVLWHSTSTGNVTKRTTRGEWYYVKRTLAMPYTDAPVF